MLAVRDEAGRTPSAWFPPPSPMLTTGAPRVPGEPARLANQAEPSGADAVCSEPILAAQVNEAVLSGDVDRARRQTGSFWPTPPLVPRRTVSPQGGSGRVGRCGDAAIPSQRRDYTAPLARRAAPESWEALYLRRCRSRA